MSSTSSPLVDSSLCISGSSVEGHKVAVMVGMQITDIAEFGAGVNMLPPAVMSSATSSSGRALLPNRGRTPSLRKTLSGSQTPLGRIPSRHLRPSIRDSSREVSDLRQALNVSRAECAELRGEASSHLLYEQNEARDAIHHVELHYSNEAQQYLNQAVHHADQLTMYGNEANRRISNISAEAHTAGLEVTKLRNQLQFAADADQNKSEDFQRLHKELSNVVVSQQAGEDQSDAILRSHKEYISSLEQRMQSMLDSANLQAIRHSELQNHAEQGALRYQEESSYMQQYFTTANSEVNVLKEEMRSSMINHQTVVGQFHTSQQEAVALRVSLRSVEDVLDAEKRNSQSITERVFAVTSESATLRTKIRKMEVDSAEFGAVTNRNDMHSDAFKEYEAEVEAQTATVAAFVDVLQGEIRKKDAIIDELQDDVAAYYLSEAEAQGSIDAAPRAVESLPKIIPQAPNSALSRLTALANRTITHEVPPRRHNASAEFGASRGDAHTGTEFGAGKAESPDRPNDDSREDRSNRPLRFDIATGDGDDEDDGGEGKYRKITVPNFPSIAKLDDWEQTMARSLVLSSPYPDNGEISWFKECKTATFENLAKAGTNRFVQLDRLL